MGTGVYTGMYLAQNFDIPKVDEPEQILNKVKGLFESAKKEVDDVKKKVEK